MDRIDKTRKMLIKHYKTHPEMQISDVFKYLFQSAFGCEHLVSNGQAALDYIIEEYSGTQKDAAPAVEPLDGEYSRVGLSYLNGGLKPETLARLFTLSAKKEPCGREDLTEKLAVARTLIESGELPLDLARFDEKLAQWREAGYPAVHHSEAYRGEYRPAYRVIANRYVSFLELFAKIDSITDRGNTVVAIEGGSASGKTTLSGILSEVYGCNVFHMDDFFLRPEQRTPERFAQIGGNVDRERFFDEIVVPLQRGEAVRYRPFDCSAQTLADVITVSPCDLNVVEGVYSTHPALGKYYDLSVFLDIDPEYQRQRVIKRNSPRFAERFFNEWIPLENRYFSGTDIKERTDLILEIKCDG